MNEGEQLIYENLFGGRESVSLVADRYDDTKNLCLRLVSHADGFLEPFATITVNVDAMPPYMAYIKNYSENQGMLEFITKNKLGYLVLEKSEKIPFPVVQFHEERLRELNCEGLEAYHQAATAKYCELRDYMNQIGFAGESKSYVEYNEPHLAHMDRLGCGQPHKVLKYQPKSIGSRIKEAAGKYGTSLLKTNETEKPIDKNHAR